MNLLETTPAGLYCPAADVYIDPHHRVDRAIITHGHADHARRGHKAVLTSLSGSKIVRERIGPKAKMQTLPFAEPLQIGEARISLHPAGHLLGSAQVRIEVNGKVAVVTGDYKRGIDPTCEPFEPVPCHLLVTETTFGLPIYRWPEPADTAKEMDEWWKQNQADGINSVLLGYSLGKAQRLLAMLHPGTGPIYVHGAILPFLPFYREAGIQLPFTHTLKFDAFKREQGKALLVISPAAYKPAIRAKLGPVRSAFASGWTLFKNNRIRGSFDCGFPVSDHVDWPELLQTVKDCAPEEIWADHGYTREVARYFSEQGFKTRAL
ncbi:ligase-associated DNA damage response exonuclease [Kiritimatiellaeota bacterium B1221]|nr:ligase-associated DNA damage response exonuclease [Kiritimatiellaeota bacterium B1221]